MGLVVTYRAGNMPNWKYHLCVAICWLHWLPRYGRTFTINLQTKELEPAVWGWRRLGDWDVSLLGALGWLYPFLEETNDFGPNIYRVIKPIKRPKWYRIHGYHGKREFVRRRYHEGSLDRS